MVEDGAIEGESVHLGPYLLHRVAGRGAMAAVWQATHVESGAPVAVKVLDVVERDVLYRRLFRDEVRAMAGLDHPGIVGIYDHGQVPIGIDGLSAGAPYLVMEWLDGGPLRPHRARLKWPAVRAVLLTLLDALAHAHARGVVHRDLKDSNIMLVERGAVLTDFGLAVPHEARPSDAGRAGTPAFMAPEQIRGAWREIGPWTDLYALGCVTHALVGGRPPFDGDTSTVLEAHRTAEPPPLQPYHPIPHDLDAWVARLLAKSPAERYRSAADAAWALMALPDEDPETTVDDSLSLWVPMRSRTTGALTLVDPAEGEGGTAGERDGLAALEFTSVNEATLVAPQVFVSMEERSWAVAPVDARERPPCPDDWRDPNRRRVPLPVQLDRVLFDLRPSAMVGRARARSTLWTALQEVGRSGLRCVVVDGDVGQGRSRLAGWLGERAQEVGAAQVLWAAFDGGDTGGGLRRMWTRSLRCAGLSGLERHARVAHGLRLPETAELARSMSAALDPRGRFDDGTPDGQGGVLIAKPGERWETYARALHRLADERPIIVVLDDVHHSTEALAFVDHLLARHGGLPVLVVLTAPTAQATAARARFPDDVRMRHVTLEPLSAEDIGHMFDRRLPLDRTTVLMLGELAMGNPLRAEQRVRTWLIEGNLVPGRRGHRLRDRGAIPRGTAADDTWAQRLERALGPWGGISLEGAATLGLVVSPRLWSGVLEQMLDVPEDDGRGQLLDAGLARLDADQRFVFVHPRVRTLLLDRARRAGRDRRWHGACATVLEREGRDPLTIASHLHAAGETVRAVDVLLDLLDESRMRGAGEMLGRAVRQILPAMRDLDYAPQAERWLRLRGAWVANAMHEGRTAQARRHARRQLRFAGEEGLDAARAVILYARTRLEEDAQVARSWFEKGLAVADAAGAPREAVEALAMLGFCNMLSGDLDEAEAVLADGLARLARGTGRWPAVFTPSVSGRLHLYRAWTRWKQGRVTEAEADARQALSAGRRAGSRERQALAETTLGDLARQRRDWPTARQRYRAADGLLDAIGFDGPRDLACYVALIGIENGEPEPERARLEDTLHRAERHQHVALVAFASILMLSLHASSGDSSAWDQAWARLDLLHSGRIADPDMARALTLAGDGADAAGMLERAADARRLAVTLYRALSWSAEVETLESLLPDA